MKTVHFCGFSVVHVALSPLWYTPEGISGSLAFLSEAWTSLLPYGEAPRPVQLVWKKG